MENHFDFLRQAKPASLYRLLDQLPLSDAAVALAGLPPALSVQVLAFFPSKSQAELMPAMREARQADASRAEAVAGKIRDVLVSLKKTAPETPPPPAAPGEKPPPAARSAPPATTGDAGLYGRGGRVRQDRPPEQPTRWVPRTADASPINGPAVPGKPQSASGDPYQSPLAKEGLMNLLRRAQERLLPKRPSAPVPPPATRPSRPKLPRPKAREGVTSIDSVGLSGTRRVIGPQAKKPVRPDAAMGGGARPMDGKAIVAAILREAGRNVRENVQHDDPSLFRELQHRMFYFDDLNLTDDGALARVFTTAPVAESSLALRFAAPALRDRVLRVVSPGRADALRDGHHGKAGLDDIEAAQRKVLAVALQLQAAGRILIDPRDPDLAGPQYQ